MNTTRTRTRRGAATLFSGVLVLGGLALASETSAIKNVDDNPTCEYLGFTYGEKWDDEPSAGTYTLNRDGVEASFTVGTYTDKPEPNENNAITEYSVLPNRDYAIVVKGGDGATVYDPGAAVPLHAPAVGEQQKWPTISHFDLCWNKPAPEPELGQLDVTKVVVGTDTPDDFTFEICVAPVGGGKELCKEVEGDGTLIFENLPVGAYVVTETDPGPRFSVKGSGVTVEVDDGGIALATITNTWNPPSEQFGRIDVTKVVTGEGVAPGAKFEICIAGVNPVVPQTCEMVKADDTVTFDKLVPGTYEVTETNPGSAYTVTINPTATVDVTASEIPVEITVTNVYKAPPTPPPEEEVVPPTQEALPPMAPTAPADPVTPAASTAAAEVSAQTALPTTGSEGGLAAIAAVLVTAGLGLTWLSKRRGTQQA